MTRRVVLPDAAPKGAPNAIALRRQAALLTEILNTLLAQVETLQNITTVETDITRPPQAIGQTAVVGAAVYVATGLTPADWTLVS